MTLFSSLENQHITEELGDGDENGKREP